MNKNKFCEVTSWWNWYYIQNQVSPHFFYYPAELMLKKGFDVEVLTKLYSELYPERNERECEVNNGIKVRKFPKKRVKFCANLFGYLLKSNYSLIHLHSLGYTGEYIVWAASRLKKIPVVFTCHDPRFPELEYQSDIKSKIIKKSIKIGNSETNVFIAFTKFQANLYKSFGIKNIRIIPHGIDPTVFNVDKNYDVAEKYGLEENNILCVGQIDPRKGQHLLIEIMPEILKNHPNTKLLLVGRAFEGSQRVYKKKLEDRIKRMDLMKNIVFLDDVSKYELINLYLLADIFAFPTDAEMFGLVFLESMAAGLPIISTDRPYIREILQNGDAGLLVKREQKEFENGILKLLDDKNLRKRLSKNGKKAVEEKYRLDKVVEAHWELYRSLIER